MKTKCPVCEQIDKVDKVSTIVTVGTFGSSTRGLTLAATDEQEGEGSKEAQMLSKKLALPTYKIPWLAVGFAGFGVLGSIITSILLQSTTYELTGKIITFILYVCVAMIVWCLISLLVSYSNHREDLKRAQPIWDMLYYCYRDDVVYLPDETDSGACVKSSDMRMLFK